MSRKGNSPQKQIPSQQVKQRTQQQQQKHCKKLVQRAPSIWMALCAVRDVGGKKQLQKFNRKI